MREAINNNRTVQLILLAVLALAGGLMLLKTTKGSGSETSSPASASSSSSAGATPDASGGVDANGAPIGSSTAASVPGADSSGGAATGSAPTVPASLIQGSGAPKSLLRDYKHGNGVALLVVRAGGVDDALVRHSLGRLESMPRLSVFVTKAKGIGRYAWLTQGVDVTELPALVILHPRKLSKGVPTASVSYGFRDAASVVQAARDALYRGPSHLPYHP